MSWHCTIILVGLEPTSTRSMESEYTRKLRLYSYLSKHILGNSLDQVKVGGPQLQVYKRMNETSATFETPDRLIIIMIKSGSQPA